MGTLTCLAIGTLGVLSLSLKGEDFSVASLVLLG
jgi:hypothetical protein